MRKIFCPHKGKDGYVLVGALIILAAGTGLLLTSLNRSNVTVKRTAALKSDASFDYTKQAVVNRAMRLLKSYHEQWGYSLQNALPATLAEADDDMMVPIPGGTGTYDDLQYEVWIGDNYEKDESPQNYLQDTDNRFVIKFKFTEPSGKKTEYVMLITPGQPEVPPTPGPTGGMPAGVSNCMGKFNWLTTAIIGGGDTISGYDKVPPDGSTCTDPNGCAPSSPNDQVGISTSSLIGISFTWNGGTIEGSGGSHGGVWDAIADENCEANNNYVKMVEDAVASGDPNVIFYENVPTCRFLFCNNTLTVVNGDVTLGTPTDPKFTLIKTSDDPRAALSSTVRFTGKVEGAGIMVIEGNAEFMDDFYYEGLVIVDADGRLLGNSAEFKDDAQIFGATAVNEANFAVLVGTIAYQIDFDGSGTSQFIRYSSSVIDNVLQQLDPNYVPASGQEAVPFKYLAYQQIK